MKTAKIDTIGGPTNDASRIITTEQPYTTEVTIQGSAAILFHAWSVDAIEAKGKARKGSQAKKEDDLESYVYRDQRGEIALPGAYLRASIVEGARFRQDPRSPRKSAMDLFEAGVVSMTELASLGSKDWDYLDRRRAVVQRQGITRTRPAFHAGWKATVQLLVLLPEYISETLLRDVVTLSGKLVGVGDYRPTFGRYDLIGWKML